MDRGVPDQWIRLLSVTKRYLGVNLDATECGWIREV